jgi:hypothetical protein
MDKEIVKTSEIKVNVGLNENHEFWKSNISNWTQIKALNGYSFKRDSYISY